MSKDLIIRSSSAEFLIFERQKGEKGIEVRFEDGDLWLTQKAISDLFDTSKQDVSYHLKNIFNTLELEEISVVKKYLTTASKISHEIACDKALTEFEKYRIKQDKLYKSDFDLLMEESANS